jgi:hypothetical protein
VIPPAAAPDLGSEARAARRHAELRARHLARRTVWYAAGGDPDRYRELMAVWLGRGKQSP